jgi:type II secretory pathway pseudopilin PulG
MIKIKKILLKLTHSSSSGFSLVELLIYMGIFMGFLVVLTGLFVTTLEVQSEASQTARIEQDSQYLYSRMQYDIGRATQLVTPVNNGETTTTMVLDTSEGQITYFLESGSIKVTTPTVTGLLLTSPGIVAHSLEFQRLGNLDGQPSIAITILLSSHEVGSFSPEIRDLNYTFGLR